jgi:hypothetical protein
MLRAGEMFPLILTRREMQQELVSYFLGPNTAIQGIIKTEDGNQHEQFPFQLSTHRECPEDMQLPYVRNQLQEAQAMIAQLQASNKRTASLRDTAINLYDLLATFEQQYEPKSHIQQERGESESDFVARQCENAMRQSLLMAADFRIRLEKEMRSLSDQIQLSSEGTQSLANTIDQATRTCNGKTIKDMREYLWECARTLAK